MSDDSVGNDCRWAGNGLPAPGSGDDLASVWASVIGAVTMLGEPLFNLPDTVHLPSELRGFTCVPIYYQYFPLRTFWPTVFIWFVPLALASRSRWMMPLGYVLAGVAFLWNADTGLLCLVADAGACGSMASAAAGRRPLAAFGAALAHAGAASATVALALAVYAAFACLRSGSLPARGDPRDPVAACRGPSAPRVLTGAVEESPAAVAWPRRCDDRPILYVRHRQPASQSADVSAVCR